MIGNNKKLIAFNYFGGKFTYIEHLYQNFPLHFTHLIDLFGGSLVVSLNYQGHVIKTANEINTDITNFFEVLRDRESELLRLLLLTPCSQAEYNNCWNRSDDKVEQARRFYVRVRQSFFGLGAQREKLAVMLMCRSYLYYSGILTESEAQKVFERIRKFQDQNKIDISHEQIVNVDFIYKD